MSSVVWAQATADPSADQIMARALERSQHPQAGTAPGTYTFFKASVTDQLDASGRVKDRQQKLYQVWWEGGLTHAKLLQVNGRAPTPADLKKQAEKEVSVQQLLGDPSPGKTGRESFLTPELLARFQCHLVGRQTIAGREAYQIRFEPKNPSPPVHRLVDRVLDRLSGTIWIDAQEYEVARAELHLGSSVDLLGGVLGSLKKLVFNLERTRAAAGVWLNASSTGTFEGRKLLESMHIKTRSQCSGFRSLTGSESVPLARG